MRFLSWPSQLIYQQPIVRHASHFVAVLRTLSNWCGSSGCPAPLNATAENVPDLGGQQGLLVGLLNEVNVER